MTNKRLFVVFLFSIILLISNVEGNSEEHNDSSKIIVDVFTDRTIYKVNETIKIYINVTNPTDSPILLHFRSSHQFDYEIRDNNNLTIFRWSHNKGFLMVLTSITLPAGESHSKSFTHTPQAFSLKPGAYTIAGEVVGYRKNTTLIEVYDEILQEFPTFIIPIIPTIILPLFMITTLLAVIVHRRKHST